MSEGAMARVEGEDVVNGMPNGTSLPHLMPLSKESLAAHACESPACRREHGHQRTISSQSAATTVGIEGLRTSPLQWEIPTPEQDPDLRVSVQQPGGDAAPPPSSLARAITRLKSPGPGAIAAFGVSDSRLRLDQLSSLCCQCRSRKHQRQAS